MTAHPERGWLAALDRAPTRADVLVVDDDPRLTRALSTLLEREGYVVSTAASSEEADIHLSQRGYDLCLLDIQLPGMRGNEYLAWALRRHPEMAVIMLTAIDDPDMALDCIDGGARTYLVKPVDERFLLRAIRDALAMRRLLLEARPSCDTGAPPG